MKAVRSSRGVEVGAVWDDGGGTRGEWRVWGGEEGVGMERRVSSASCSGAWCGGSVGADAGWGGHGCSVLGAGGSEAPAVVMGAGVAAGATCEASASASGCSQSSSSSSKATSGSSTSALRSAAARQFGQRKEGKRASASTGRMHL